MYTIEVPFHGKTFILKVSREGVPIRLKCSYQVSQPEEVSFLTSLTLDPSCRPSCPVLLSWYTRK